MKISLKKLNGLSWDEGLSEEVKKQWVKILVELKEAESVTFKRCVKPSNATGKPILIVSNDGSELAMCTTAHVR